jgi:hypothetical protein
VSGRVSHTRESRRACRPLLFVCATLISTFVMRSDYAAVAKHSQFDEPIFSLTYDPSDAHFTQLQTKELMPNCKKALSGITPLPSTFSLYAQYITESTRIYIAGTDDDLGIYVLRDGGCEAGIPILAILQRHHNPPLPGEAPALSEPEIAGLFSDALIRYSKAFGGKERFFQWLDTSTEHVRGGCKGPDIVCPPTYHMLQPALQRALENYRKS